jgi:XisH protein
MAKDIYHNIVREALEKDGWLVTEDPYKIKRAKRKSFEVDLGTEKTMAAERGAEKIAVEIKSFIGSSRTYDFHSALGQYSIYQFFMTNIDPDRKLFLAITDEVFNDFFLEEEMQIICTHFKVKIVVFNAENKIITTWSEK